MTECQRLKRIKSIYWPEWCRQTDTSGLGYIEHDIYDIKV